MNWQMYISEIYSALTRASLDPNVSDEETLRMQLEILYSLYLTVSKLEEAVGADRVTQIHEEVREHIGQRYKLLMNSLDTVFERP